MCRGSIDFYPRPPGGGRQPGVFSFSATVKFLSTPSGWRATMSKFTTEVRWICISIHALRVEGDRRNFFFVTGSRISIHALRVEGDSERGDAEQLPHIFLSTPSGWRATVDYRFEDWNKNISIHALRVEGDRIPCKRVSRHIHFYPRPPGGGRPVACVKRVYNVEISIHALRVEGDASGSAGRSYVSNFYPRPPGGGRL